ncbi:hypothetical protein CAPTEDRAFT_220327 [Capitella teleta]|uniref:EGF-like domain-containing protein n=1 Tax=Capitella teleta TaxID=283909 RepID=R7V9L7_CAPTE|nr:hypothetical protein CAPTEDRAFT_220327 [Capitella teleta]|eukprot:ELU13051.1 hypothetical protein CAPTEDRAFT_220327 [Capitella teleta]
MVMSKELTIVVFVAVLCQVTGSGQMSVRLVLYDNPGGKGDNGHCCDGRAFFCPSGGGCDHYFIMCVDEANSPNHLTGSCDYHGITTGTTNNKAYIEFGSDIGGVRNPFQFSFNEWPVAGVKLKANVYDHDNNNDDFVDYVQTIYANPPHRSQAVAQADIINLIDRTTLAVKVWCDANFYGARCATRCVPADDDLRGHYTCNVYDGSKICGPGWGAEDCRTNIDECESNPCQNQATCADEINSYSCSCVNGTSGLNCEVIDDVCFSQPCLNGGKCMANSTGPGYLCSCQNKYTGEHCESELSPCDYSPCFNNGVCLDLTNGSHACECQPGWHGQHCNETGSPDNICLNGGSCVMLYDTCLCICPDGFSGSVCQNTSVCASQPCLNNATCEETDPGEFQCVCADNYHGALCETDSVEMTTVLSNGDVTSKYTRGRDVTSTQGDSTSAGELKPTLYPVPEWSAVMLKGNLNQSDSILVKDNLKEVFVNSMNETDITISTNVVACSNGESIFTIYYFKVLAQEKEIRPEEIRVILKTMDAESYENLFPLPVYWGDDPDDKPCETPMLRPLVHRGVSGLDVWVIVACAVGGLCLVIIVISVVMGRKRRYKYGVKQKSRATNSTDAQREVPLRTSNISTELPPPLPLPGPPVEGYLYNNAIYESVDYQQMADLDNQPIISETCAPEPTYDVPPRQDNVYVDAPDPRASTEYDIPPRNSHYTMVRGDTAVKQVEGLYDIPKLV